MSRARWLQLAAAAALVVSLALWPQLLPLVVFGAVIFTLSVPASASS